MAVCVARPLAAQQFVYHVRVDPIFGDNDLAYADATYTPPAPNTGNPTAGTVFSQHPSSGFVQQYNPGPIQHAPFSFRTLSGAHGALAYVNQFLPLPNTFNGATMTHIVFHCLPGMYGPGTGIDPRSGLPFNGEAFPLLLTEHHDRVSLQGTSALNTIFDAQGAVTDVIRITSNNPQQEWFKESYIDGLTIRGARSDEFNAVGAAIAIKGESSIRITISNCFLTANQVGIAIWNDQQNDTPRLHTPIVVNNTIAFNQVGIWSGALFLWQAQQGWGKPRILNNVIDSKNRFFPVGTVTSCFEGVHLNDTTVRQAGTTSLNVDMNAWDVGMVQRVTPPGYPATAPRSVLPQPPGPPPSAPRVDILPYTNAGSGAPHGTLYVSDLLRNYQLATGTFTPDSEHDFRLSPLAGTSATSAPTVLNPLVNMGLDVASLGAIEMMNANQLAESGMGARTPLITAPPGLSPSIPPNTPMHAWDWDTEGFGNPRIVQRLGGFPVPNPPNGPSLSLLDLGADECADLIMGGTIFGTTIFARLVPSAPGISDHTGVYFFDVANVTRSRPLCTIWLGQQVVGQTNPWWTHVQSWGGPANYTSGKPGSTRNAWSSQNGLFMRNLECDVSPHLAADLHPWWGLIFGNDGYAANPWYRSQILWQGDNYCLYYAPGATRPGYVADGTLNPPGSWVFIPGSGFGYLFPGQTTYQFGPFNGGGPTFTTNAWGIGDAAFGQDIIPDTQGYGLRFTCESSPATATALDNIQSFLGINSSLLTEGSRNAARRPGYRASVWQVKTNELPDLDKIQRDAAGR